MALTQVQGGMIVPSTTLTTPIVATTMGVGGATPAASGVGITFPATQSASSDANTLDDYEEGTFTVTVIGYSSAGTASYSAQGGKYTKIGNIVYFNFYIIWTGGTGIGALGFTGLPFTQAGGTFYYGCMVSQLDSVAFTGTPAAYVNPSSNSIVMQSFTSNSTATNISYDAAGNCLISGCYTTA
jgi:hypothetical protein